MKKVLYFIAVTALLSFTYSCGNSGQKETTNKDSISQLMIVDDFLANSEKWANKEVTLTGTVSHVCKHSGKKLFLFGKDPNNTLKINAGGNFSAFDIKLEGSDVEITGKVVEDAKVDEQYLKEWESDIKTAVDDGSIKVCTAEGDAMTSQDKKDNKTTEAPANDPYADVKAMRKKLQESGKSYISIYALDCITLKEIKK